MYYVHGFIVFYRVLYIPKSSSDDNDEKCTLNNNKNKSIKITFSFGISRVTRFPAFLKYWVHYGFMCTTSTDVEVTSLPLSCNTYLFFSPYFSPWTVKLMFQNTQNKSTLGFTTAIILLSCDEKTRAIFSLENTKTVRNRVTGTHFV